MTTTTTPIPLFPAGDARAASDRLRGFLSCSRCQYPPDFNLNTRPITVGEASGRQRRYECSPAWRIYSAQAVAVAAWVALRRAVADDELSRPLDLPDLKAVAVCHALGRFAKPPQCPTVAPSGVVEEEPVREEADVEPPPEFRWSKARRKVRAAAKAYSEQTHADY